MWLAIMTEYHVDIFSDEFQRGPQKEFERMQTSCPVAKSASDEFTAVSRCDDIVSICRDTNM